MDCLKCGKKLSFFRMYCDKCKEEIRKAIDMDSIMIRLGFMPIKQNDEEYYQIDRKGTLLKKEAILSEFKKKVVTEEAVLESVNLVKEMLKIKEREERAKLKERAEKEYYGKVKTKRQSFDNDIKEAVYTKYDNSCAVCGGVEGLHIHHKDKNSKNNKLSNLILLCGVCHKKVHMKVR